MKLDIRNDKIDPNSEFAKAFDQSAKRAFIKLFGEEGSWHGEATHFKQVRQIIDGDMMDYLLAHDGVVDGWPEPDTGLSVVSKEKYNSQAQPQEHYFHYFGVTEGAKVWNMNPSGPGIKYYDEYEYEYTPLYNETVAKGEYTGVTPSENREEIMKYWLVRMPMIWGVIAAVVAVLGFIGLDLSELGTLLERIGDTLGVAGVLLVPLVLVFGFPAAFAALVDMLLTKNLGILGLLIGCAVLLGGGYAGFRWLIFKWNDPTPLDHKEIKRKFKEKKAYRNSAEYKRVVKEEKARFEMCVSLSWDWHHAWFECYKREHPNRGYYKHDN